MRPRKDGTSSRSPVEALPPRARMGHRAKWVKKESKSDLPSDEESFNFSFELGVRLLQQGCSCWSQEVCDGLRRVFHSAQVAGDQLGLIDACSWLRHELVTGSSWEQCLSKGNKRRWVRGLAQAIQYAWPASLIVHPSLAFTRVTTFLGWFKRVPVFIRPREIAVSDYLEGERRLQEMDESIEWSLYIPRLRMIWDSWFNSDRYRFELRDPFLPQHGSGSTADCGRVLHDKWRTLQVDAVAHVCLRNPRLESLGDFDLGSPKRTAKVVFVPKQAGKDRCICMEPAWLQYLQQGVARQLVEFIHEPGHPLSKYIDIFSQERNRELCAWAVPRGLATIDLTDASDSVSWLLIRELTRGTPFYRYLVATRSRQAIVDGKTVSLRKFAPMGSALCFPIECILFASVVELAYRIHYSKAGTGHHVGCSVYGDDIVCPVEIYHLVVDILTSIGFKVNDLKSFSSGPYRESCGVEYLHGVAIESLRHPRSHLYCQEMAAPEQVGLVTDLANNMYSHGYFHARRYLLKHFERTAVRVGSTTVPFMDLVIFDRDHLVPIGDIYRRPHWDRHLQCQVERRWVYDTTSLPTDSDFLQWRRSAVRRSREDRIRDLYPRVKPVECDPRFSRKGVTCLSRYGLFDLLEDGDIKVDGTLKTGHLRHRLRLATRTVTEVSGSTTCKS